MTPRVKQTRLQRKVIRRELLALVVGMLLLWGLSVGLSAYHPPESPIQESLTQIATVQHLDAGAIDKLLRSAEAWMRYDPQLADQPMRLYQLALDGQRP